MLLSPSDQWVGLLVHQLYKFLNRAVQLNRYKAMGIALTTDGHRQRRTNT
jgi:hypothetical protein